MQNLRKSLLRVLDGTPKQTLIGLRQRGQSLVELALITPLLILLVVGIVEIGWYANHFLILLEVTRVGARSGTVLTGDLDPLSWNERASTHPTVYRIDNNEFRSDWPGANNAVDDELLPNPNTALDNDGVYWLPDFYLTDPDTGERSPLIGPPLNFRDCDSASNYPGFYNFIVCTMLDSLEPLTMKGRDAGSDDFIYKAERDRSGNVINLIPIPDDIVISVFALQAVNNDAPANWEVAPGDSPEVEAAKLQIYPRTYDFGADYDSGFQTVVAGRYPTRANECNVWFLPAFEDAEEMAVAQSPFHLIESTETDADVVIDTFTRPDPIVPGNRLPLTLYRRYANGDPRFEHPAGSDPFDFIPNREPGDGPDQIDITGDGELEDVEIEGWDYGPEMQRGFVWTGQHAVIESQIDGSGNTEYLACIGSEWTEEEVTALMNLPTFLNDRDMIREDWCNPVPAGFGNANACVDAYITEQRRHIPSNGLVLVEMFWGHTPLLNFPGLYPLLQFLQGNAQDVTISVWAAFPAPAVEPNVVFQLP